MKTPDNRSTTLTESSRKPLRSSARQKAEAMVKIPSMALETVRNDGDLRVHFEFQDRNAKRVYLAGSFNGWDPQQIPLKKRNKDTWELDLNLEPGTHEYRFVVDGNWIEDPRNERKVPNPFDGANSVLDVRISAI